MRSVLLCHWRVGPTDWFSLLRATRTRAWRARPWDLGGHSNNPWSQGWPMPYKIDSWPSPSIIIKARADLNHELWSNADHGRAQDPPLSSLTFALVGHPLHVWGVRLWFLSGFGDAAKHVSDRRIDDCSMSLSPAMDPSFTVYMCVYAQNLGKNLIPGFTFTFSPRRACRTSNCWSSTSDGGLTGVCPPQGWAPPCLRTWRGGWIGYRRLSIRWLRSIGAGVLPGVIVTVDAESSDPGEVKPQ
jgi:hypothetical protein